MAYSSYLFVYAQIAFRGVIVQSSTCFCNREKEDINHVFFGCEYAKTKKLKSQVSKTLSFPLNSFVISFIPTHI